MVPLEGTFREGKCTKESHSSGEKEGIKGRITTDGTYW